MIVQDNALKVVVMGNYDVVVKANHCYIPCNRHPAQLSVTGTFINLSNAAYTVTLQPGEYCVHQQAGYCCL